MVKQKDLFALTQQWNVFRRNLTLTAYILPNTALLRKVKKKESYEILQVLVGFIYSLKVEMKALKLNIIANALR